jgi:hypothetical protein
VQEVADAVSQELKTLPNSKMFLRALWFCTTLSGVLTDDHMHVYTLARQGLPCFLPSSVVALKQA